MPTNFPDVVPLLIGYLNTSMTPLVASRVPDPRPEQWVQVRRNGGVKLIVRDQAIITFTVWDAVDEDRCFTNLKTTRSLVHDLQGTATLGPMVYRVQEITGPMDDNDEQSGDHLKWFSAALDVRAD